MAHLTHWREPRRTRSLTHAWDPERMLRAMAEWDPFAEMEPAARLRLPEEWFSPDVDLKETTDSFVFRADLPGVKEEDIDISVSGRQLTISGKREQEKEQEGERFVQLRARVRGLQPLVHAARALQPGAEEPAGAKKSEAKKAA